MSNNPPSWYIPSESQKPAGPFTDEQIVESWRSGQLNEQTMCWREGMPQWLPLSQVDPFSNVIRVAEARPPSHIQGTRLVRMRSLLVVGGIVTCGLAVVLVVWTMLASPKLSPRAQHLLSKLRERDQEVRQSAIQELGNMGADGVTALALAIANSGPGGDTPIFWRDAASALQNLGPEAIPALTKAMRHDNYQVKTFAAVGLGKVGAPAIPALTVALKDRDKNVRSRAAFAFSVMGPQAEPAIPVLKEALRDWNAGDEAAAALGKIGPKGVAILLTALRDERRGVCDAALGGLGIQGVVLGPKAKEAVSVLIEALGDSYEPRRRRAAVVLGKLGPDAGAAVPALVAVLQGGEFDQDVVWALGEIGPAAGEAVPILQTFQDKSTWHQQIVARALAKIGSDTMPLNTPSPTPRSPELPMPGRIAAPPSEELPEPEPGAATEPSAPPFENGVLLDNDLSVSVVKCERHVADKSRQQGIFMRDVDGADITLAFRRVSTHWPRSHLVMSREFRVIITDDRGNEYEGLKCLAGSRVLYGGSFCLDGTHILYGTPSNVQQMPVGFTWTGRVKVQMPSGAPIEKVELERKLFRGMFQQSDTRRFAMNTKPSTPDFDFDIPSQLLLSEGTTIEAGRDLRSKVGHLAVHDSFTISRDFGPKRTERGLSLSLPIEFTNMDYNAHTANVPQLSVQFENGEVVSNTNETVTQSADLQDSPGTLGGVPAFEIPGKSTRTLVLRVDIAASMNAEVGLNIRMILLYVDGNFRGFVSIPDDARRRIRVIAGKGSVTETSKGSGPIAEKPRKKPRKETEIGSPGIPPGAPPPDENLLSPGLLAGTWQTATGERFRIDDDGKTVTIKLEVAGRLLQEFTAKLTRREKAPKFLDGDATVIAIGVAGQFTTKVTGIVGVGENSLRLRCLGGPRGVFNIPLTHEGGVPARPGRRFPRAPGAPGVF